MKTLPVSLLLAITAITISSCNKSNPVGPSGGQQIWPLNTGDTWVYEVTDYDSTGVAVGSTTVAYSVTSDTAFEGSTWYHLSGGSPTYYTNKSDGFWLLYSNSSSSQQQLMYKYPAEDGDSWSYGPDTISVQSTDTSVTVPEGTHDCFEYLWSGSPYFTRIDYVCPGLGWIRSDYFVRDGAGQMYMAERLTLSSVRLN